MKKRILSVCLCLALLLGLISATGILPTWATTDGWTAGANGVGQYMAYDQFTQLSAIMGKTPSLIAGKTAYGSDYGTAGCGDTDANAQNWYHETDQAHGGGLQKHGYAGGATDGKIASNHNGRADAEEVFRSNSNTTIRYFYYDLGAVYDVSDFIVASSQCNIDAADRVLKYISVYVAEEWTSTTAFTKYKGNTANGAPAQIGFTQVFEWEDATSQTYIHRIQPTDGATVKARYVCFGLKSPCGSPYPIPISELAVYGTESWEVGDNGAGRYKTFAQYDNAYLTELGDSLVKNVIPYYGTGNSLWSNSSYQSASAANGADRLTDGAIRSSSTDTTTDKFTSTHRGVSTNRQFTFDLGQPYDLTDFVAASSQNDSGDNLLRWVKVYVGDSKDTLYTDTANLVYSRWDQAVDTTNRNFHIQPTDGKAVTGRYVGFELQTPSNGLFRIEELAVYGTAHKTSVEWATGDDGKGQYKPFEQYNNAYLTSLGTSLVEDVIPHYGKSLGTPWSDKAGNASWLTDGAIRTAKTDTTTGSFNFNVGANNANRFYTFELGAKYDLTDFVVASSQTDTAAKYLLHSVKVYVSDSVSTLYDESSLVYSRWQQEVDLTNRNFHIQPADGKAVTGCYVGFHLMTGADDTVLRVEELGVYGTKYVAPPKEPDADGVISWEIGDDIDTENNLLNGAVADTNSNEYVSNANPDWTTVITDATDGNAATAGKLYNWSQTDGYKEVVVGDTALKGTSGMASMAFNLCGTYSIEKLLLIGSASDSTAAVWSYAGEDAALEKWGEDNYALNAQNRYQPTYADGTFRTFNDKTLQYYEVYVSTSAATLFDEANRVWAYTNKNQYLGTLYALPKAVTGSYIGYRMTTGSTGLGRIGEMAVYGTPVEDTKIVTVGDSITHGSNLVDGRYFKNYPSMLAYLLNKDAAKPYSVYNAGISGSTVVNYQLVDDTAANDASWLTQGTATGHVRYADILTVMLGTNDANSWASRKGLYKQEYKKIIDAYKALNPNLKVYVATSPYTTNFTADVLGEISALQKELATELGATLIDVYAATAEYVQENGRSALFKAGDLLHPHEKGQAFLSTLFYKGITGKDADLELDLWNEGELTVYEGVPQGSLLQNAELNTSVSSNANPNWSTAYGILTNRDPSDAISIYAKDFGVGYPEVKNPATGAAIQGTTGWATVMFKLDDYYSIDRLLLFGQSNGNPAAKWSYAGEDKAKETWGENYTLSGGRYYCAYAPNGEIRTFNDRNPQYVEVYVSDYPGMLFDADSLVWSFDNTTTQYLGYGITLTEAVKGQYVGVRVTTGSTYQARLGELAVYGEATEREYTGTLVWNEGDAIDTENNLLVDATRQRDDALGNQLASNLGPGAPDNATDGSAENKACYYNYGADTDTYYAEVTNPVTGAVIQGTTGWARIAYKLDTYTAIQKVMVLGSVKDKQTTQWGYESEESAKQNFGEHYAKHTDGKYYASYADGTVRNFNNRHVLYYEVYIADDYNHLFDAENLVFSFDNSRMLLDGAIHELDEAVEGRYVGFRTTAGTNNQSRLGELGVYGYTVEKDITLTADTTAGKITYTIITDNTPDRLALLENVGSLVVTEEPLDSAIPRNIDDNWLTVDNTTVYHVQLLDKQGNLFPDTSEAYADGLNGRPVQISIPAKAEYMQTAGLLKDGVIHRVFNAQKTLDGRVLAGTVEYPDYGTAVPNNREKAVISTADLRLVLLRFNDPDTISKLNGEPINPSLGDFRPDDVAGAADNGMPVLPVALTAVVCMAGLAVALTVRRRRRGQ